MSLERSALAHNTAEPLGSASTWTDALRQRSGHPIPSPDDVAPPASGPSEVSRRAFIRLSFWGGLGISLLGAAGTAVDFLYPRNVRGFGGPVPVGFAADYVAGAAPVLMREAQAWLVNLDPSEDRLGGAGGGAGLLALWQKCPHLGCAVPWNPTFSYEGDGGGWFRCPCHRSTYTKAASACTAPRPARWTRC